MSKPDNGLLGGIRNAYLRRLALIAASPLIVLGLTPAYLRALPSAIAEAWDGFASHYRPANALCCVGFRSAWSKDWKPVQ